MNATRSLALSAVMAVLSLPVSVTAQDSAAATFNSTTGLVITWPIALEPRFDPPFTPAPIPPLIPFAPDGPFPVDKAILTIDAPASGSTFVIPSEIKIQATAIDPDGDIRKVEFLANGQPIGTSQHFTKDAVIPGRPRVHYLEWPSPAAGAYKLTARATATLGATVESEAVLIHVRPAGPEEQIVRIFAGRDETSELIPGAFMIPGQFVIERQGDLNRPLRVFLSYGGTAIPDADYPALPEAVAFEPGQAKAEVLVMASMDSIKEDDEELVAKLVNSPLASPLPDYIIDASHASATVVIHDTTAVSDVPVVGIEATRPQTMEPSPTTRIAPALFTVWRTGPLESFLEVFLKVDGSATPDVDYTALPKSVKFEPGQKAVELLVGPLDDDLPELDETVAVELVAPPFQTIGFRAEYVIDANARAAKAVIHDNDRKGDPTIALLSPKDGEVFPPGGKLTIEAVAIDPSGYIPHLEFLNGRTVIGVSEINFITAPPDGTPIYHHLDWAGPAQGEAWLSARVVYADGRVIASKPVHITFGTPVDVPVIGVETTRLETTEPSPTSRIAPALFTLWRQGPLEAATEVFLRYDGSATPDLDYSALPRSIKFEPGQKSVELAVVPLDDDLPEFDETVSVEIIEPPVQAVDVQPTYLIAPDARAAKVLIRDNDRRGEASITMLSPHEGDVFAPGERILIEAVAVDPDGYIPRIEFLNGDQVIGVSEITFIVAPPNGSPIHHQLEWAGPAAGEAVLSGRVIGANGQVLASKPVRVEFGIGGNLPVVGVHTIEPRTLVAWPDAEFAPGAFEVYRIDGELDQPLSVRVAIGGNATPGVDYEKLPEVVEIPAGEKSVLLHLVVKDDDQVEGTEAVVLEVLPWIAVDPLPGAANVPPVPRPELRAYRVDPAYAAAKLPIFDNDTTPASQAVLKFAEPEPGARLDSGEKISLVVTAWDPLGYISHVEFYEGEKMLGVSDIFFIRAPEPGTPIRHEFVWLNVPEGKHEVFAKALDSLGVPISSFPVAFSVVSDSRQVILAVEATDWLGAERGPDGLPDAVVFSIQRVGGPKDVEVQVRYRLEGSATNGKDYAELSGTVTLPANQGSVDVVVKPLPDDIEEGDESVALILEPTVCIAIFPPPPDCYLISERAGAKARLVERVEAVDELAKPRFLPPGKSASGKASLKFGARVGQRCILETSDDLVHWQDIGAIEVVDGEAALPEDTGPAKGRAFFRLRTAP